jgi:hypothetical protein
LRVRRCEAGIGGFQLIDTHNFLSNFPPSLSDCFGSRTFGGTIGQAAGKDTLKKWLPPDSTAFGHLRDFCMML